MGKKKDKKVPDSYLTKEEIDQLLNMDPWEMFKRISWKEFVLIIDECKDLVDENIKFCGKPEDN